MLSWISMMGHDYHDHQGQPPMTIDRRYISYEAFAMAGLYVFWLILSRRYRGLHFSRYLVEMAFSFLLSFYAGSVGDYDD
jgi:hypothetical protein